MAFPRLVLPAVTLLSLVLGMSLACAQSPLPAAGTIVSGHLALFDKQIPIPAGSWRVASTGFGQVTGPEPGPYGAVGGVLLVRAEPDADRAFLLVHTNALPVREGWGTSSACSGPDYLVSNVTETRDLHEACSFVVPQRRPLRPSSGLPALTGLGAIEANLPSWALIGGVRVSDRRDFVDMRLGLAPAYPEPSGWFAGATALDARRQDMVRHLSEWALLTRRNVAQSMRAPSGQITAVPFPSLEPTAVDVPRPAEDVSVMVRGLYKLASYRVINTATSFVLAVFVSGNVATGTWVAFWQAITHSAVFMANELAWEWPTPSPVIDLAATTPSPIPPVRPTASPPAGGFVLAGKIVPLPEGSWTPLALQTEAGVTAAVLARVEGSSVKSLVVARTNLAPTEEILGPPGDCGRQDIYFAMIRLETPRDAYCVYSKLVVPAEQAAADDPLWAAALDRVRTDKLELPATLMMVGMRPRTRENFLDLRYYFAADATVLMSRDKAAEDPAMQARINGLRAWADLAEEPAAQGLRGRAGAAQVALPEPWPVQGVDQALVRESHAPLEALRDAGALSGAAFERQIASADLAALQREQQRWSFWTRSMYKVATYRVAAYVDTVLTSWVVTGSFGQGVSLANLNAIVKPVIAYANEVGWAGFGGGGARTALLPTSFPEIGLDRF